MVWSDASAMTEASGITNDLDATDSMSISSVFSHKASREALLRTTDLLRKVTVTAPVSSLAVAFMIGIVMARRR